MEDLCDQSNKYSMTNKTILVLSIAAAFVVGTISTNSVANAAPGDNGQPFDFLGMQIEELRIALTDATNDLQSQINDIELTPGPQGEQGPPGTTEWSGLTGIPSGFADDVDNIDDADSDPSNEIQTLQLTGNTLSISSANQVELPTGDSITANVQTLETCVNMGTSTGSTPVGWCPDGVKTKFTIQVNDSLVLPALIPVSLDASTDTGAICSVTDQGSEFFGEFFVVQCTNAPHSSASLQYAIITS